MYPSPDFPTSPPRLATLARALLSLSAKWTHHLSSQELKTLYGILSTMLHDVYPNEGNMAALESILEQVPQGKEWWPTILVACEAARRNFGEN